MAKTQITRISTRKVQEKTGLLGKKTVTDELLCMDLPGGSVCLRRSAVIAAGDNYFRLKRQMMDLAKDRGIEFVDETED